MPLVENEWGFTCSWCGKEVERVNRPDHPSGGIVGVCPDDGIVEVNGTSAQ